MDSARLTTLGVVVAGLGLCGCTLIGYGIGKASDRGKPPKLQPVARDEVDTLSVGARVEVVLWDGRKVTGRYDGLRWTASAEYRPRYEDARRAVATELALPALGEGARLVLSNGTTGTGEYIGVGPAFVWFREAGAKEPGPVRLHRVVTLADAQGVGARGEQLKALIDERRLPTLVSLAIDQPGGEQVVPHEQVAALNRLEPPHGGRTGLIVGFAIDVAIVTAAAVSLSQPWSDSGGSTTTTSSCPLLDSFDGREFVLDAEPLGGAFYSAAERTDVVRLDRLVETDGEYRLRLRNDQWEVDHVDAVALRVVDHEPGSEVVPDGSGRLILVREPVPPAAGGTIPSSAHDRRTGEVATLLAAADGEGWVSDAWGRDPRRADHLRDGVELAYRVPPEARRAVLVARVGATALGPRVLHDVLALHGRDLETLYARLQGEPATRAAFERVRERDVLPAVRAWGDGSWREAGRLRDLPSLVRRDQAVPIDLAGIEEGTLRLRIEGPPGLWALDRAVVAFESGTPDRDVRVAPSRAVAEDGTDLTPLLGQADRRRHSLRPRTDTAVLRFAAPPRRAGRERTVLAEVTGYYNVMVAADGEPRPEAFRRLLEEPDGVARFALERLAAR